MTPSGLTIGTRGSDLALYQSNFIKSILDGLVSIPVSLKIIKTQGDRIDNLSFDKMEGKGFFTKELEDALLARQIDLAVHSLKDLMTSQPEGLKLGTAGYRADCNELLLIRPEAHSGESVIPVRPGSRIGTSAARRQCQIAFHNPELTINDLRGNVPTRVGKLREGQYDAILIAAAGVRRLDLDLSDLVAIALDPHQFLPAPAQGILGIQIRENDPDVDAIVGLLGSKEDMKIAELERGLLKSFGLGCSLPLGVVSDVTPTGMRLAAVLGEREEGRWLGLRRAEVHGTDVSKMVDEAYHNLKESRVWRAWE